MRKRLLDVFFAVLVIVLAALILIWIGFAAGIIGTGNDPPEPSGNVTVPGDLELLQISRGDGFGLPRIPDPGEISSSIGPKPVI